MNEVEEIRSRLDIVELVGGYVNLKKAGANYKGVCPFHHEKTASLMVSPEKQIWKCFGCGKGGDVYNFIMESETLEFGDALRLLAGRAGVTLENRTKTEHQTTSNKSVLYQINNLSALAFAKILKEDKNSQTARDYLMKRHITAETIEKYRLGYAPQNKIIEPFLLKKGFSPSDIEKAGSPNKFYLRIIFPLFDVLGNIVAFTARTITEQEPKYLNTKETIIFNKSRLMYGLNFAKGEIKQKDRVILVEGQMDVLALHQAGLLEAVATSGTAVTEEHLKILSKYTQNIFIAMDNDSAGVMASKKIVEMLLKMDLNGKVVDYSPVKDAADLIEKYPDEIEKRVKNAKEMVDWLIDQTIKEVGDTKFVESKKKILKIILPSLRIVTDKVRLDYYLQRISSALNIKPDAVYESFGRSVQSVNNPESKRINNLTSEERFLSLFLLFPELFGKYKYMFDEASWQSQFSIKVAGQLSKCALQKKDEKCYNDKGKDGAGFLDCVKEGLEFDDREKINLWFFEVKQEWPNLNSSEAEEMIKERFTFIKTKEAEAAKMDMATKIKQAEEAGDIEAVKKLLVNLSELTKK